ncbi:MAG: metallophosphoesterase [Lachnospiraceae bacterium]|nr:metallophosphoesterase [Lachnospiraceae bacterium]
MNSFRWLHLSDFHTGKDGYGQNKLFTYIHEHIRQNKENGLTPDAIFITGDIANKGLEKEYNMFFHGFIEPLKDIYEKTPRIYIIPGNHDIDRNQNKRAAQSLYNVLTESTSKFFDTDAEGLNERKEIFGRFENFQNCISDSGKDVCFPVKEIFEEKGCFTDILPIGKKKVGIIGINTAWLSSSDDDKEKLTPGKYILEEALNTVKDCEYKIVLGHHPLDWLQWEHRQQITTLLIRNKAMYLNGHLHKNSGEFLLAYNKGSLILQSGAAFQARENEKYYNSLQWGELDFSSNRVKIKPKKWSEGQQCFETDSPDRLLTGAHQDGQDYWQFPYALSGWDEPPKISKKLVGSLAGWSHINQEFIEKRKQPSDDEILKYFDGKEPSYNDIFSSRIPTRKIVTDITREYIRCNEDNTIRCAVITGAGGEGKTTVLLQTVRELTEKYGWNALVLRHSDKNTIIPIDTILELTKDGSWIVCADNCFPVAGKLFKLLEELSKKREQHVHFLLCARDIDWSHSKASKQPWDSYSDYRHYKLRGIDEEDAKEIINAWASLGEKGLGKLSDLGIPEAIEQLCLSSKDEKNRNDLKEGALLGAMFAARYGEELKEHVRKMLLRLKEISIKRGTLLDAYAYIVAMHSERLNLLYKEVIAQLYGVQLRDVKKDILRPLGDEAATAVSGEVVYTRHILIAQAAREIMEEEFEYDFDEIFIELSKAVMDVINQTGFKPSYRDWKYLGDHFIDKNRSLTFDLYQSVLDKCPKDPQMTVHLSEKYRETGQYKMALPLFRDEEEKVDHRPFFCEWALVEANMNNKFASVFLSALTVADDISTEKIDEQNSCISLYSIARTFYELYSQDKNDEYLRASLSAIRLGEKIKKNDIKIQQFIQKTICKFDQKILNEDLNCKECLQKNIKFAAENAELSFKSWIPKMSSLRFSQLFSLAEQAPDKK